jgi:hypothetical protein
MHRTRTIAAALAAAAVLAAGWYAFRPERLFVDAVVDERLDAGALSLAAVDAAAAVPPAPVARASGRFHSVAHETAGEATIYVHADGRRTLRLAGFSTSNGPDVRVLLIAAPDASDDATVRHGEVLELGTLKGNIGDQNYEIPADADLSRWRAVTIWCKRFGVNFGTAPLAAPEA